MPNGCGIIFFFGVSFMSSYFGKYGDECVLCMSCVPFVSGYGLNAGRIALKCLVRLSVVAVNTYFWASA